MIRFLSPCLYVFAVCTGCTAMILAVGAMAETGRKRIAFIAFLAIAAAFATVILAASAGDLK